MTTPKTTLQRANLPPSSLIQSSVPIGLKPPDNNRGPLLGSTPLVGASSTVTQSTFSSASTGLQTSQLKLSFSGAASTKTTQTGLFKFQPSSTTITQPSTGLVCVM